MSSLNKQYIAQKFKFSNTHTIVILNNVYQQQLSCITSDLTLSENSITIKKNISHQKPYHLLFLTSHACDTTFEIIAQENCSATIIEEHISLTQQNYTQNINVKTTLKRNSTILYTKLQSDTLQYTKQHITTTISQASHSKLTNIFFRDGAQSLHEKSYITLDGEQTAYKLRGINMLHAQQSVKDEIEIQHHKPHSTSDILIKNILDNQAVSDFICRIITHQKAMQTTARVYNKNLLLTPNAVAHSAPEMEIYTDDVDCTHGATVGQLDTEALFYLRSRGISQVSATKMLLLAFTQEITAYLPNYPRLRNSSPLSFDIFPQVL